ncbi:hypothetical protein LN042_28960 [Kitasatospora sp. RB6PN24]|uniref:hypothetical protein n=1 Tax=Kitasatospora humi TaxID=2893891 RepID=UPI001E5BA935|nr:hypothetical protein [Kitasatospora humi]MCC9311052.1 hypothetical protein [Kitasatospora humi]
MLAPARIGAALLAAGLLTGLAAGPAPADSGSPSAPAPAAPPAAPTPAAVPGALYGKSDPAYDGVYRQSPALLALKSTGQTPPTAAVDWPSANAAGWLQAKSGTDAAATATLVLTAKAAGRDPHAFAGADLVSRLTAAGPAAPSAPAAPPAAEHSAAKGLSPLAVGGISLVVSIGIGYVISLIQRRKRK